MYARALVGLVTPQPGYLSVILVGLGIGHMVQYIYINLTFLHL